MDTYKLRTSLHKVKYKYTGGLRDGGWKTYYQTSSVQYRYEGLRPWGRIIPLFNRQNVLYIYYSLDMNKAFMNILLNVCKQHNVECPIVESCCTDFYKEVTKMTGDKHKGLFYDIMFDIESNGRRLDNIDYYKHLNHEYIDEFKREINNIIQCLKPHYKLEYYYAKKELSDPDIVMNYWFIQTPRRVDTDHLFLHILLSRIENEIIQKLYEYIKDKETIGVISYDGIIIESPEIKKYQPLSQRKYKESDKITYDYTIFSPKKEEKKEVTLWKHKLQQQCNDFIHKYYPDNIVFNISKTSFTTSSSYAILNLNTIHERPEGSSDEYDIKGEAKDKYYEFQQKLQISITPDLRLKRYFSTNVLSPTPKNKVYFLRHIFPEFLAVLYHPDSLYYKQIVAKYFL